MFYVNFVKMDNLNTVSGQKHVKVCRVCLIMDVKMHDLHIFPLNSYFEAVSGIPVINTMDLPLYLCYECVGLVKKFVVFKDRCLRGHSLLYGLVQTMGKVTEEDIGRVDRNSMNLKLDLTIQDTSTIEIICHTNEEETIKTSGLLLEIKQEPSNVKENDLDIPEELCSVKDEDNFSYPDFHDSSDDEPLSLQKTVKEKKKERRGRKKKSSTEGQSISVKVKNGCLEIGQKSCDESQLTTDVSAKVVRRKGRPLKADEDGNLEEYTTVVTLSLEAQMAEISARQQSSNYLNAPFKCQLCYKGFIDPSTFEHHQEKHHPSAGDVECPVCKFRFPSQRRLKKHIIIHEKKYICKACDYVSRTTTQAKNHHLWHKGVTYVCPYCDEVSTKWTSYLSHVRIKHPSPHVCAACGYSFVSRLGLSMHRTMMHKDQDAVPEDASGPYCAECDVKFVSDEAYNRHRVTSTNHTHADNFKLGCRVCGVTFPNSEDLRLHHRKEHPPKRYRRYRKKEDALQLPAKCEHCDEEIENAREYWAHFRRAHPDKPYPIKKDYICDVCGKSFRGNAFLMYHKRTHTQDRPYACGVCGKAFFNRTNLNMHERTHSDHRPHPCPVCCKAFKSKGALDRHYRIHTGEKPYSCEVCGKSFGQSNSCKLHVRTVHLRQPAPYLSRARANGRRKQALAVCADNTIQ